MGYPINIRGTYVLGPDGQGYEVEEPPEQIPPGYSLRRYRPTAPRPSASGSSVCMEIRCPKGHLVAILTTRQSGPSRTILLERGTGYGDSTINATSRWLCEAACRCGTLWLLDAARLWAAFRVGQPTVEVTQVESPDGPPISSNRVYRKYPL
jgi:hypothetical protein